MVRRNYSAPFAAGSGFANGQDKYCSVRPCCLEHFASFGSSRPVPISPFAHSFELFNVGASKFLTSCAGAAGPPVVRSGKAERQPAFDMAAIGYVTSQHQVGPTSNHNHGNSSHYTTHSHPCLDLHLVPYLHPRSLPEFTID